MARFHYRCVPCSRPVSNPARLQQKSSYSSYQHCFLSRLSSVRCSARVKFMLYGSVCQRGRWLRWTAAHISWLCTTHAHIQGLAATCETVRWVCQHSQWTKEKLHPPVLHTQIVPVTAERRAMLFLVCHQIKQTGWEERSQDIIECVWVTKWVSVHMFLRRQDVAEEKENNTINLFSLGKNLRTQLRF